MLSDDAQDLIAAFAIDAIDPAERAEVELLLHQNPNLWDDVVAYREVAAVIALDVESTPSTPSHAVWDAIAAAIGGADETIPELRSTVRERRARWFSRIAVAVSVAAMAVAGFVGFRLADITTGNQLQAAVDAVLRDPDARVVTLTAPDGSAVEASVVIGEDGIGYIYRDTLPALASDRTYQLWAIVSGSEGRQIISAGVLGSDPQVSPFQVTGDLQGLAITNEIAGGVVTSEEAPTALWLQGA